MADFFYPHKLFLKINNVFVEQFECGEQPNTKGKIVDTMDRKDYVFQSLIFVPNKHQTRFKPGQEIQVIGEYGEIRISGKVARFDFGRLEDNRIWI